MKNLRMILSAVAVVTVVTMAFAFTTNKFSGQCLFQKNAANICVLKREVSTGTTQITGKLIARPVGQTCSQVTAPATCADQVFIAEEN